MSLVIPLPAIEYEDQDLSSCNYSYSTIWCWSMCSLPSEHQTAWMFPPMISEDNTRYQVAGLCDKWRCPHESKPAKHWVHSPSAATVLEWACSQDGRYQDAQSCFVWWNQCREVKLWFPRKHYKDQLKEQLFLTDINQQRWQLLTSDRDTWYACIRNTCQNFEGIRVLQLWKRRRCKEQTSSKKALTSDQGFFMPKMW